MEREKFNDWFRGLLYHCKSCYERDVLRGCKEQLWASWLIELEDSRAQVDAELAKLARGEALAQVSKT